MKIGLLMAAAFSTSAFCKPEGVVQNADFVDTVRSFYYHQYNQEQPIMRPSLSSEYGIGDGAYIEFTNKANGVLHVHNLSLRVFDANQDGIAYQDGVLRVRVLKSTAGVECLVVDGTVFLGDGVVTDRQPILIVYKYDCVAKSFSRVVGFVPFQEQQYLLEKL